MKEAAEKILKQITDEAVAHWTDVSCPYVLSNMGIMALQETVRPLHDAGGSVKDPSFENVNGKSFGHTLQNARLD
jgi:hypothetical protein